MEFSGRRGKMPTHYRIGIAVQYPEGAYTLAGIEFNDNGDVVVWMNVGDEHQLVGGTKQDPHTTYHADGKFQLRSYPNAHRLSHSVRFRGEKNLQPINSKFSGSENLIVWGFNREDAKTRGYHGAGFNESVVIEADAIKPTQFETIVDDLGEFTSAVKVGLATFQVDLVEPGRYDLRHKLVPNPERIVVERLIEATFPWCMVAISSTP